MFSFFKPHLSQRGMCGCRSAHHPLALASRSGCHVSAVARAGAEISQPSCVPRIGWCPACTDEGCFPRVTGRAGGLRGRGAVIEVRAEKGQMAHGRHGA